MAGFPTAPSVPSPFFFWWQKNFVFSVKKFSVKATGVYSIRIPFLDMCEFAGSILITY